MPRKQEEINAGSMADIAFMLLIFFLVATTMDVDKGISTKLPPIPEDEQKEELDINKRNIMVVLINRYDKILLNGEVVPINVVRERAKEFIANPYDVKTLPEKKMKQLTHFGNYPCTKAIISLQNDRGTTYETYLAVRNELTAAYRELRDGICQQKWGKKFADIEEKSKLKDIRQIYPNLISEAEPKNIK